MTQATLSALATDLRSHAARIKGTEGLALRSAAAKADKLARALEAVAPFYTLATAEVQIAAPVVKAPRKAATRKAAGPFWKAATPRAFWGSAGVPKFHGSGDARGWHDAQWQYGQPGGLKASPELASQLASQWKFTTTDAAEAAER